MKKRNTLYLTDFQLNIKKQTVESLKKHKEGAIHLATGLGKSYIARSIIDDIIEEDPTSEILWISGTSDYKNVRNKIFQSNEEDKSYYKNITFLGFDLIRTDEKFIDKYEFENLKLIVIDEAHAALAEKTYESIKYTLKKLHSSVGIRKRPGLLAMTASDIRSCDGKEVFKILTPSLVKDVDYIAIDLEVALDKGYIGKVNFINSNIYKYELMARAIIKRVNSGADSSLFKSKQKQLQELLSFVEDYKNNLAFNLGNDVHNSIKEYYNAKDGDQWIIFYRTTEEALDSQEFLQELFKRVYVHNKNVKINIFQYHNKMSEEENDRVNKLMNSKPDNDTVNVYVTVNKGGRSVHPEHIVGEIQFRSTKSLNFYEQAIGRVTKAKEYADTPVFVIDVVGNKDGVKNGQSINYGLQETDDRIGRAITEELEIEDSLSEIYFKNVDFSIINTKFYEVVKTYNELKDATYLERTANEIADVLSTHIDGDFRRELGYNPFYIIRQNLGSEQGKELCGRLSNIQHRFINGDFGRATFDTLELSSNTFRMLYKILGDCLFINSTSINTRVDFIELKKLANGVREKNFEESRINRTKWLSSTIEKYKNQLLAGTLTTSAYTFCEFYRINLYGDKDALVNKAIEKTCLSEHIKEEFRSLQKKLKEAEKTKDISDLTRAYAMMIVLCYKYNVNKNSACGNIINAMKMSYSCLRNVNSIMGVISAERLALAICNNMKTDKIGEKDYNPDRRHIDGRESDNIIINTARKISQRQDFTDIETEVLKLFGINTKSSRVHVEANELMKYTNVSNIVDIISNAELDDNNDKIEKLVDKLKDIILDALPIEWKKIVTDIIAKYTEEDNIVVDKNELINECRYKIGTLSSIDYYNKKALSGVESSLRKAFKHLTIGELLSSCFIMSYQKYVITAIDNIANKKAQPRDIQLINYAMKNSSGYEAKLMFIQKTVLVDSEYKGLTESIIKGQVNS